MSNRPAKAPGMPWMSAHLVVRDPSKAIDFYQRAFGFEKKMVVPGPDGQPAHVEMTYKDGLFMFGPEANPACLAKTPATSGAVSPMGLYFYVDDVDALFARATGAGAESVKAPENMFYGDRSCTVRDPDGYLWSFATNFADFDPSKVPH
ncbi:MAG: VOC family protein [Gemmataceae bacterium]|nr:VOC family protein [Gemmataceae bacterium]